MKKTLLTFAAACMACFGFAQKTGTLENPLSVDEYIEQGIPASPVANTYVKGYIVGYVNAGVTPNEFIFKAGDVASNILIAGSSQEDDKNMCIAVQLPSGAIRTALNVQNNPQNIGHEVIICGTNQKYCGISGLKEASSYQWVGTAPAETEAKILGSADAPLTVTELLAIPMVGKNNVYLKGYIVGCVKKDCMNLSDAVFNATDNPSNTNILLAAAADCTDTNQMVAVQVSDYDTRDLLCLEKCPQNLGKLVTIYGSYEKYFGIAGVKGVAKFSFGDKLEGGSTPTPAEGSIYSALNEKDETCTWTFDNISLPEALTYVFSWKEYNGSHYLNASAYLKANYAAVARAYSPTIDLAGYTDVTVSFEHAAKFQNNPNVREEAQFQVRDMSTENSEWKTIEIPTMPAPDTWTFVNSGAISLKEYEGKKIQLAFLYTSSEAGADTWEFKNLVVEGTSSSAVEALEVEEGEAIYFNLQGVRVANPENGLYIKVVNGKSQKVVIR